MVHEFLSLKIGFLFREFQVEASLPLKHIESIVTQLLASLEDADRQLDRKSFVELQRAIAKLHSIPFVIKHGAVCEVILEVELVSHVLKKFLKD